MEHLRPKAGPARLEVKAHRERDDDVRGRGEGEPERETPLWSRQS